ncbi:helix-turn-helix domain-containing protein [Paenisporosarcina indica]|uniref:helix-turn-helix domain-containing protein n=1 Tax=Paenisporosarcina indica TaxID=650093 RepID=UPI00094F53A2|nr:helix-turn-helix transcriptional regulator [Paenisporosarcina indica]
MEFNTQKFGQQLKYLRQQHGLSMLALGRDIGTSASQIKSWENGNSVLSANWVVKISERFNISTDLLLKSTPQNMNSWEDEKEPTLEDITDYLVGAVKAAAQTEQEWEDILNGTSSQDDLCMEDLFPGKTKKQQYMQEIRELLPKLSEQDLLELYTLAEVKARKERG